MNNLAKCPGSYLSIGKEQPVDTAVSEARKSPSGLNDLKEISTFPQKNVRLEWLHKVLFDFFFRRSQLRELKLEKSEHMIGAIFIFISHLPQFEKNENFTSIVYGKQIAKPVFRFANHKLRQTIFISVHVLLFESRKVAGTELGLSRLIFLPRRQ